jgi:hypothetical protein
MPGHPSTNLWRHLGLLWVMSRIQKPGRRGFTHPGKWTVPLKLPVSLVYKFGQQRVSLGGRWYADTPEGGPEWGLRVVATFPTGGAGLASGRG